MELDQILQAKVEAAPHYWHAYCAGIQYCADKGLSKHQQNALMGVVREVYLNLRKQKSA